MINKESAFYWLGIIEEFHRASPQMPTVSQIRIIFKPFMSFSIFIVLLRRGDHLRYDLIRSIAQILVVEAFDGAKALDCCLYEIGVTSQYRVRNRGQVCC